MNRESLSDSAEAARPKKERKKERKFSRASGGDLKPLSERMDAGILIMTVTAHIKGTEISAVKLYAKTPDSHLALH